MTSCPFWLTRTRATCTQQVTHTDIKKKVLLYFKRLFLHWLPDEFEKYCSDVEHTAAWGGQLEVSGSGFFFFQALVPPSAFTVTCLCLLGFQLRALTQVLQLPIEVVQASAATIKIGEEFDSEPITLAYVITSAVPPGILYAVYVTICVNPCAGICVTRMDSESITILWSG